MIFTCYDNNKIFFHKGMDFAKSFEAPELKELFSPGICIFTLVQTHRRKRCVKGQVFGQSIIWKLKPLDSLP